MKYLTYLFVFFSLIILSNEIKAQKLDYNYNLYYVNVDLGTDDSDPLFFKETLVELIKGRVGIRLPGLQFSTNKENCPILISINLLTQKSDLGIYKFASALNVLVTTNTTVSINNTALMLDDKEEVIKAKIRDYIDKWILEYSANYFRTTN